MNFLTWLFTWTQPPTDLSPEERDDAQTKVLLRAQAEHLEREAYDLTIRKYAGQERRTLTRRQNDRGH